jgi:hypothetical protein
MMSLWTRFEDLVLEYMEARVAEMLEQGDVNPTPRLIANVREAAAFHADLAVARFQANNGVGKPGGKAHKFLK